jgi:hypothetical protein
MAAMCNVLEPGDAMWNVLSMILLKRSSLVVEEA